MIDAQVTAPDGQLLDADAIRGTLEAGLGGRFAGARVLVLIPDHTRTAPLPQLFPLLVDALRGAQQLDFMVALGTHPPLDESARCRLVSLTPGAWPERYRHVGLLNHAWDDPGALAEVGMLPQDRIRALAGAAWHPSLGGDVPVRINRLALDHDHVIILGPVFPHEVVGFSGGAKFLFHGISGPVMINVTQWLGALLTVMRIIGVQDTPVRAIIEAAAEMVPTPITLVSLVVIGDGLAGLFIGDRRTAWRAAADLSARRHIIWTERPFRRALSCAPPMYDELWTAAKAVYKVEPAVADGGEVVIYAPHLRTISHTHGHYIHRIGYHVLDYFLQQWEQFKDIPLGVLAHSTHVRGVGSYEDGVERPRIQVTLASQISSQQCVALGLGYLDPDAIRVEEWQGREEEGILYVPKAGEMLYRLRADRAAGGV